jgi:hypothetical protein
MNDASGSDRRLLVPISIEALVVEEESRGRWCDLGVDFSRLYEGDTLGSKLTPALFVPKDSLHKPGVHLHWALPAAHRRGGNSLAQARRMAKTQGVLAERLAQTADEAERNRLVKRLGDIGKRLTELVSEAPRVEQLRAEQSDVLAQLSGALVQEERKRLARQLSGVGRRLADLAEQEPQDELKFPVIPNRWLVQRIWRKPNTNEMSGRAWVVESDYRYAYDPEGDQSAPDTAMTVPILDALPLFDYVGKSFDYPDWQEGKNQAPRVKLTALGYGDPAFAAYYPACKSVLGFHDPLDDVTPDTALAYVVVGWYSDPATDILRCFDMEELNWTCSLPPDSDSYPTQTLCHGAIYDIQWTRQGNYPSKIPFLDATTCAIAIGNTSAEALAALLAKKLHKPTLENLLVAFSEDLLSKDTDYLEMESRLHQHRFGSSAGGAQFFIQKKEAEAGQPLAATDATLPQDLEQSLARLNALRQDSDRQERELLTECWELYATWYKWALTYLDNRVEPADITPILEGGKTRIGTKEQALAAGKNDLNTQRNDIAEIVQKQFCDLEFVTSLAAPFWHASDPVVLVSAPGLSPSSASRRGRREAEKERLSCRVTGQEITALIVDIPNGASGIRVRAEEVAQIQGAVPSGTAGLPQGIGELLREALILDPANADAIAEQAYINAVLQTRPGKSSLIEPIKRRQRKSPTAPEEAPATSAVRIEGVSVSPALIALRDWDGNPWLPLFIEWQVSWRSSYASLDRPLEHWQLNREDGEFQWIGEAPPPDGQIYRGVSIVSSNTAWNLQERLEKYNERKGDQNISQVLTQLGEMNILAQTLGGLHNAFLMRDQILQLRPPINPGIFSAHPPENPKDPIIDVIGGMQNLVSPDPDKPFFPIRAGHLRLLHVWIVDAFGQYVTIPSIQLIRASSLTPQIADAEELAQFPPRFAQPLRLRFDWVPAENPPGTYPVNSPICGWVIPNHLDHNLLFYDAGGTPLGVLQKILRLTAAGGTGGVSDQDAKAFFWVPMPGTSHQPETIHNPELKYFVQFLEAMGADTGEAFWNLLDDALAKTDPGEPEHDALLSVLLGRPLALARASVKLELDGLPATNQSWESIGKDDTGGFTRAKFPVCLGDATNDRDGLIGCFIHDSSSNVSAPFYAAAGATQLPGLPVPGVIEYKDSHDFLDCETSVDLTLLMDPRAMVHLTTGILPRRSLELPSRVSSAAKSAQEAFFQVAPLIGPGGDVSMPLPSDDFGKWSWAYRPQVTMWKEAEEIIAASDRAGFSPIAQQVSEGWLKLKTNPVAILSFWVKEGTLEVPMNTNVTLAWVLQGSGRLTLLANENEEEPVKVWDASPLPDEYRVQVQADTTYTLILLNKDNSRAEKRLTIRLAKGNGHGE